MIESTPSATDPAAAGWESAVVLGLGNPGPDYAGNRHNVGAMLIGEIATEHGVSLKRAPARLARAVCGTSRLAGARVVLARLTTYMNESGQAVRPLLDYYKAAPQALIVAHDELDLPFGTIRIKQGGGDNGHNGLRSITQSLATPDYVRIRIGIGRPVGRQSPADFVLRDYTASERAEMPGILDQAAGAVLLILERGVVGAQNELHRP